MNNSKQHRRVHRKLQRLLASSLQFLQKVTQLIDLPILFFEVKCAKRKKILFFRHPQLSPVRIITQLLLEQSARRKLPRWRSAHSHLTSRLSLSLVGRSYVACLPCAGSLLADLDFNFSGASASPTSTRATKKVAAFPL